VSGTSWVRGEPHGAKMGKGLGALLRSTARQGRLSAPRAAFRNCAGGRACSTEETGAVLPWGRL